MKRREPFFLPERKPKPMLATKPKPKPKATSAAKPKPPTHQEWAKAREIKIPIRPHDKPPLASVEASILVLRRNPDGWFWRVKLDSPNFHSDVAPRHPVAKAAEQTAVLWACEEILRMIRRDMDVRIQNQQTAIASVLAQAAHDVGQWRDYLKKHGSYPRRDEILQPRGHAATLRCPNGCDIIGALEAQRQRVPGTAIAKRSDVPSVIDVPSTPAEKLTTEEKRLLNQREKEIERSAHAFLDLGKALAEIQSKRLYRATHKTFESYLAERWHIERSVGYGLIAAVRVDKIASAIADKTGGLRITNESQCRPLAKLDDAEIAEVLKQAAKKIAPDAAGAKVPTAKIFAEVAREYTTPPEDLKRQRERAAEASSLKAAHQRQGLREASAETPSRPADSAGMPSEYSADSLPADGSDPGYWNGQPNPHARRLHGLAYTLFEIIAHDFSEPQSHGYVVSLLRSIAADLEHGKFTAGAATVLRRAK